MTIEYFQCFDDLLAFYSYWFRNPAVYRAYFLKWFVLPQFLVASLLLVATAFIFLGTRSNVSPWVCALSLWLAGLAIVAVLLTRLTPMDRVVYRLAQRSARKAYHRAESNGSLHCKATIVPDEFTEIAGITHSTAPWTEVDLITATDSHIFINIRYRGAAVIPKNAFAKAEDVSCFIETAKRYRELAWYPKRSKE